MNHSPDGDVGCQEVLDRLFAFVDNEMPRTDWEQIRDHLDICDPCLASYRLECLVKALVARSCCEDAPAQLRQRVLDAIRYLPPA
jgi:mycothiol system anti-sigma-R factor